MLTLVFVFELVLRLAASGDWGCYWRDHFNLLDWAVVISSVLEVSIARRGPVLNLLHGLRLLRFLKIARLASLPSMLVARWLSRSCLFSIPTDRGCCFAIFWRQRFRA